MLREFAINNSAAIETCLPSPSLTHISSDSPRSLPLPFLHRATVQEVQTDSGLESSACCCWFKRADECAASGSLTNQQTLGQARRLSSRLLYRFQPYHTSLFRLHIASAYLDISPLAHHYQRKSGMAMSVSFTPTERQQLDDKRQREEEGDTGQVGVNWLTSEATAVVFGPLPLARLFLQCSIL